MAVRTSAAARIKTDLIWASGLAKVAEMRGGGAGALLGFDRVRPPQTGAFRPRRQFEISPAALDRLILALKRWRVDMITIDDAVERLAENTRHRFVSISLNGIYRDVVTLAAPILASRGVPFTVYVPSAFPDGLAGPWWLALESVIAARSRISLLLDRKEQHFAVANADRKTQLYEYLFAVLRNLPPRDLAETINDLTVRYGVDMDASAHNVGLTWDDILKLSTNTLVTIGSATVNYPVLSSVDVDVARRDIAMGRAVLETVLQRPVLHFAFPFGDAASFTEAHSEAVRTARFASGVTAVPGVLDSHANLHALPRLIWSDRMTLRGLRVRLAGY